MDYQKQADDFMTETGTKMTAKLLGYFPYFPDDKESRDVYEITLTRGKLKPKSFTFKFGQSIANSSGYLKAKKDEAIRRGEPLHKYAKMTEKGIIPTAYDILSCLTKYEVGSFDDFCCDYGYDTDSRKALDTYVKVQEEFNNVKRLFGDVMDDLQEIQ